MIQNFRHKGLRLLWEQDDGSKLPPDLINRIERMLDVIEFGDTGTRRFRGLSKLEYSQTIWRIQELLEHQSK